MRLPAAERRRQLLEIATDVFASRGYHDSSMNDIADAAGVTKPVLYQHFDSKRELYLELLRDIGEDLQLQISKATADAGGPRHQIQNGFGAYFEWMSTHPAAFRLLFGTGTRRDPDFAAEARKVEQSLAIAIGQLIVIDGLTPQRRQLLALGIVGIAESTCRNIAETAIDIDPAELADQVAELAWFGLRGIRSQGSAA
jgi:AcrR family transcriptional regulator